MPELPEVHTTVNGIRKAILGKTIDDVWSDFHLNTAHGQRQNIKNKKYFTDFKQRVIGARVKSVERKGKHIIIHLSGQESIVIHMKMTGHLLIKNFDKEKKFIHFILRFSDESQLAFSDMRKFGTICVARTEELPSHPGLAELGPDALAVGSSEFVNRIKRSKKPIKLALLDQAILAGIGNIYSDEILWQTGVHPFSIANKIPIEKLKKMYAASQMILKKSIKLGGDSMSDYLNAFGEKGGFQKCHRAYRRTGQKCPKAGCRGIIKRLVIGGRSAHFCAVHQTRY